MGGPDSTQFLPASYASSLRVHAVDLEIAAGPDLGRRARVDRPLFVIGSGEGADLRLNDGAVSREHLRLHLGPEGVRVRDEGSTNGTWIGGLRVADVLITSDTVIEVGTTSLALRIESGPLDLPLSTSARFGSAIGVSEAMRHLFALLERAAASDVTILLEGESGAGKEVLARAVHSSSPRKEGPFVPVDCGAIPPTLIEAELFGHERGAFTGAAEARKGYFEQAEGGTIFLDEIGELPLDLQPKLLRVLEQREVRPLGATGVRSVNVRVIAATNRRLAEAARKNEFRQDLFYRLAVARVVVPPLRDRPEDIIPLAREFLRTALRNPEAELPVDLAAMLHAYRWPGNVRELRNVIDRYAFLGMRDARGLFDGSAVEGEATATPFEDLARLPYHEARKRAIELFEHAYLPKVLEHAGGVVARAAELAEVARPSFYRMLERIRGPSAE
ncbi:MAG: sigma 54-dependent Fis family transcriptional regulator [Deltaproteobacteria bacterium]|nr:sigma 54-dependent Fis family transcriptional regulator [Deltaproteobacteria bacterium]